MGSRYSRICILRKQNLGRISEIKGPTIATDEIHCLSLLQIFHCEDVRDLESLACIEDHHVPVNWALVYHLSSSLEGAGSAGSKTPVSGRGATLGATRRIFRTIWRISANFSACPKNSVGLRSSGHYRDISPIISGRRRETLGLPH